MRTILAAAVLSFSAMACTPPASEPSAPLAETWRAPESNEIAVTALVTKVEDGAYPQFTVTATPETGDPLSLYLDAESADLGGALPSSFEGQSTTIYYTAALEHHLVDLRQGQRRLLPEPTNDNLGLSVTGILSGAEEPTAGDLPDTLIVTDAAGQAFAFEYYITPGIVAANGQQVTAVYFDEEERRITLMRKMAGAAAE